MKKLKNTNKGITLIALVITIIVMLILVAVTISMAVNGGLFEYASNAGAQTNAAVDDEQELASGKLEIDGKWYESIDDYLNNKPTFNAEKWDEKAAPQEVFIWQSDDKNDEGYGVVVGYRANLENYPTLRFPSRCTKITSDESRIVATENLTTDQIRSFTKNIKEIELPETVVEIGDGAFCHGIYYFRTLEKINIPGSVTIIGHNAFSGCTGITSVTIPNSVTKIGSSAFSVCSSLTSVIIPDSVTTIGSFAFVGCSALTNIKIPSSVKTIEMGTFHSCSALTSMAIPDGVTSIKDFAFSRCSGLTSVIMPGSVTSVGQEVFSCCTALTSITVDKDNMKYDSRDNCNAIIETETNSLVAGCRNTIIPNSVKSIGIGSFYGCTSLTSIIIPDSITSIDGSAFFECTGLTSVTMGDGLRSIGGTAFYNCTNLTNVTISSGVISIGQSAFYNVPHIEYHGSATGEPWGALSMN